MQQHNQPKVKVKQRPN